MTTEEQVARLPAIHEIQQLVFRYAYAFDTRDFDEYRALWADTDEPTQLPVLDGHFCRSPAFLDAAAELGPTFLFVGVVTMIGYFQLFAEPYVMTAGGPLRATTSLVLFMYEEGLRWWRMGVAAAIAFVLFGIILLWSLLQMRVQRERA